MTGQVKEEQERDFRQERREHWNLMLEGANDEHERTRFFIDSRLENLYDRLDALERRVTREMGEHAETTRIWLIGLTVLVGILVVLLFLGTIWRS